MHFMDPTPDTELLAALKDEGVLAPDIVARIDESMGRPESGTLDAFLLAGAEHIPEKAWLSWLIRRHGCHRFGRVGWREEAAGWAGQGVPPDGNLPFRRCADGSVLVAVLRPDRLPATVARLGVTRVHPAAATLREIRDLAAEWRRRSESGAVAPQAALPDGLGEMHHGPVRLEQGRG
jgi:hypothetical protein